MLEVKLRYLDKHITARQEAVRFYDEHLKGVSGLKIPGRVKYSTHTFHQYTIQVEKRDDLKRFLETKGIPSRNNFV